MSEKQCKVCFDRTLPTDRFRALTLLGAARLVAPLRKQWINGSILKVRFMGGSSGQHNIVKEEFGWWMEAANIKFDFNNAPNADIRIAFDPNDGAWSYVGTDNANISLNEPTMNLGFLDRGTAAHEAGHAIGCAHEHQNPEGGIQWNEDAVYQALAGPPNYWDRDTTFHNVLRKYSHDQVKATKFDPSSIMLYFFPSAWTMNGIGTEQNEKLSEKDREFIGSREMYPKTEQPPMMAAKRIIPNHRYRTQGTIKCPGEEDLYVFTVPEGKQGKYTIDTRGNTNVAMRLFGPNSQTLKIAEDDDSGIDANAVVHADLIPGEYYVQVRHSDQSKGTGKYTVKCFYRPAR
jgi:hypothetical protein